MDDLTIVEHGTAVPADEYLSFYGWSGEIPDIQEGEDGFGRMVPADFNKSSEYYDVLFGDRSIAPETTTSTTSTAQALTTTPTTLPVGMWKMFSAAFILFLLTTGLLASLSGFAVTIVRRKRCRHYKNFLHLITGNILVLIPMPFVFLARLHNYWAYGENSYKLLCIFFNLGQTASAFQLSYLVFIRCREVVNEVKIPTNGVNHIICCLLWLGALSTAWPSAIYVEALADVIKSEDTQRLIGARLYIPVYAAVSYFLPGLVTILFFVVAFVQKRQKDHDRNISLLKIKDMREAAVLFVLFYVCWLPFKVWRIDSLRYQVVPGFDFRADAVLCTAIAFSTALPIAHHVLHRASGERKQKVFSTACHESKRLSVESV